MAHDSAAHETPPAAIKSIYKGYQKSSLDYTTDIIDPSRGKLKNPHLLTRSSVQLLPTELRESLAEFLGSSKRPASTTFSSEPQEILEVSNISGLYIYPSLLPPEVQVSLLDRLLHRDLCNAEHKTNVQLHHHVPYPLSTSHGLPSSYFDQSSREIVFQPKDPTIHKAFKTQQFLDRKLRWMTLGGQYDWTNKVYPSGSPPPFPTDIKNLIEDIFPMKAEAAILNLYSPGDTLSLHRDVSEECDQPLVSISIGCDGIFVVGLDSLDDKGNPKVAIIRLKSGDAVLMSRESRFAWHGIPKVLEGTCPEWLQEWPFYPANEEGDSGCHYENWRGWMKGKRINLNVRQMFA